MSDERAVVPASTEHADAPRALPTLGDPPSPAPRERADAARNRQRILAAAADLFAERGVADVTMDDVAARARVGKGTVFRRFGDRSGLAAALLDEQERDLQARMFTDPAPLGPGRVGDAKPADRLAAFVDAYLGYVDGALELVLLSQTSTPGARHRIGSHTLWTIHCRVLLAAAGAPDAELLAEVLLAAMSGEQVKYWRHDRGLSLHDLRGRLTRFARNLAAPPAATSSSAGVAPPKRSSR